jgi:hypothetical protein
MPNPAPVQRAKPHSAKVMGWHGACVTKTSASFRMRRHEQVMTLVTVIIKAFKLIEVRAAPILIGVFGVTVLRIRGFAMQME